MDAESGIGRINTQRKERVYKSPVPYDKDVPTTSALAKFLFRDGFQTCAINKRLTEFCAMRKIGLFRLKVKSEIAEVKVRELLMIYLYVYNETTEGTSNQQVYSRSPLQFA